MKVYKIKGAIKIVGDDFFEEMMLSETYMDYGQRTEVEDSCDYEVTAANYWDGHNWKTIFLEDEYKYCENEELSEDESSDILEHYDKKEHVKSCFGEHIYETEKYVFIETQFVSDYAIATVEIK